MSKHFPTWARIALEKWQANEAKINRFSDDYYIEHKQIPSSDQENWDCVWSQWTAECLKLTEKQLLEE